MSDSVLFAIILMSSFFPVAYALYNKLDNKLLFLFAIYGADGVISVLLTGAVLPLIVLGIYELPQLERNGLDVGLLVYPIELGMKYGYLASSVVFLLTLPPLIRRRYRYYFTPAEKQV